jgi:hypothetical protein
MVNIFQNVYCGTQMLQDFNTHYTKKVVAGHGGADL